MSGTGDEAVSQAASQSTASLSEDFADGNGFELALKERNVWHAVLDHEMEPENWTFLQDLLRQPRGSPEATDHDIDVINTALRKSEAGPILLHDVGHYSFKDDWNDVPSASTLHSAQWVQHVQLPLDIFMGFRYSQLPDPKPAIAYGWKAHAFRDAHEGEPLEAEYPRSVEEGVRESHEAPYPLLYWPTVAIEARVPHGTHWHCHLRSQHSGAVMLNNRFWLKRKVRLPLTYDQSSVLTVDIVPNVIQLHCHWITLDYRGEDLFMSRLVGGWF